MQGVKIEPRNTYSTNMEYIFECLDHFENSYNWLLTDYECNIYLNDELFENRHNYLWMDGKSFFELLYKQDIQFIWGVFSAFDKSIELQDILKYPFPESTGEIFKNKKMSLQNPLATTEIIAWDSSCTYIVTKDGNLLDKCFDNFESAKWLNDIFNSES